MSQAVDFDRSDAFAHVPNPWEIRLYPDSAAAWTVNVTPGSATAGVLAQLDPARLSQAGRVDALVGLERLQAWAAALQVKMIAALIDEPHTGAPAPRLDRDWAKEDVKTALAESITGAQARIHTATDLVHRLPDTLTALEQGRVTARHAHAVVDTVRTLEDTAARQVEATVLPEPERINDPAPTLAAFRRKLRRAGIKADPRSAEQKAARAAEDRDVWVLPQENGMAYVGAPLPTEGAATVSAAVDAKAEQIRTVDDPRTKAQRRADGLVQICADYLNNDTAPGVKIKKDTAIPTRSGAQAPRYHGLRPQIQVSVALSTLLGLDDQPGEIDGHGPIPADLARRLASDPSGTWRRLVTDELGHLIDYGRTTYQPPADLAQYVIARDRTFPRRLRPHWRGDPHRPPAANARQRNQTCTTSHPGAAAATPTPPTWSPPANASTTASTTQAGKSPASPTAPSSGPHPPDTSTRSRPPPTPSTTPRRSKTTPLMKAATRSDQVPEATRNHRSDCATVAAPPDQTVVTNGQ